MSRENPLVYLAVPYTHKDKAVMEYRFIQANKAAGMIMRKGEIVYSPISHCHPIHLMCEMPGDWEFWKRIDKTYINLSHKMYVLKLDGWESSNGVQAELLMAEELELQIIFLEPNDKKIK